METENTWNKIGTPNYNIKSANFDLSSFRSLVINFWGMVQYKRFLRPLKHLLNSSSNQQKLVLVMTADDHQHLGFRKSTLGVVTITVNFFQIFLRSFRKCNVYIFIFETIFLALWRFAVRNKHSSKRIALLHQWNLFKITHWASFTLLLCFKK